MPSSPSQNSKWGAPARIASDGNNNGNSQGDTIDDSFISKVFEKRTVFIRALTSRLAELKETSEIWRGKKSSSSYTSSSDANASANAYLATLRHLRDNCHETCALDVLATLTHCNGGTLAFNTSEGYEESSSLHSGFPSWSYPTATSLRWARYAIPVVEGLLYSAYEDYLIVAIRTSELLISALHPLFESAADYSLCNASDLDPVVEEEEDEEEASSSIPTGPVDESGEEETNSTKKQLQLEKRLFAHALAVGVVEAVRITIPLISALGSAAAMSPPSNGALVSTQANAGKTARRLQIMHASVAHITTEAASRYSG
jgi:hypothetical protein